MFEQLNVPTPKRQRPTFRARRIAGGLVLAASTFCGVESVVHFAKANEAVARVQAVPPAPPGASAVEQSLWHQSAVLPERIVLVGEETAMRVYGVGALTLGALGFHLLLVPKPIRIA